MSEERRDLVVIGGGINGTGIARDAAGRGLNVLLCEQHDLAGHTSSASTKLIHGGLRYLEYGDIGLVRKALREREVLLRAAQHIIWPLRFVIPHEAGLRPRWMIRAGLFLYDHLGGRKALPASRAIHLDRHVAGPPLRPAFTHGFEYSDCWVQDSRLVVLNALDAAERGAAIRTRTACLGAGRHRDGWTVRLKDQRSGAEYSVQARAMVNAAGPWVSRVLWDVLGVQQRQQVRLVKGSHIVVPRLHDHDLAYTFQQPDGRVVFAIPYEQHHSLIGTTDEPYEGDPASVAISERETAYLCDAVNHYFRHRISPDDVRWSFAGVRPLFDDAAQDASRVTRDYVLDLDSSTPGAPLLSVYGGKLTTYRRLAEDAMALLGQPLGIAAPPWTASTSLPGGDIPGQDFDAFLRGLRQQQPWLPEDLAWRYARNYGTRCRQLMDGAGSLGDLGRHLGCGLYEAELRYLQCYEWAQCAEDVLWRRSRVGLHVDEATRTAVEAWFHRGGAC